MKNSTSPENNSQENYDTIIIGSGVGGLTSAICLAREGQKVLVLEQHDVPGGWCHSFYLNGYRFTPGVHYVGLMTQGQSSNQLYSGLGIANDIGFYRMNPKGFDHCWIGEERFNYSANWDEFQEDLIARFPHEEKGITKYLKLVRNVGRQLQLIPKVKGLWQQLTIPFRTKHMGKYSPFTLKRVINWHVKDPLLQNILNIQFGNHGLPPGKASFIMHAAIMCHYAEGGFYPMGGGGALVKAMTNKIKGYNGKVKTSTSVKSILLEGGEKNKKAVGVELASGEKIFAKRIISNADPAITYFNLVGKEHLSKKLLNKLNKTTYSCTSLMLFLTVDMDVKKAGLDSGNIWRIPNQDMDDSYSDMQKKDILEGEEFSGMFISCTSLKDPISFDGRYHTLEAITYIHYDAFEKFKDEDVERSPEYLAFKEQIMDKFLVTLEKVIPGITPKIVNKDLGTPMTNEFYLNSTEGSVYGTEKSLRHIGPFSYKPKTEIENLYMCGASVAAHGVTGAGYSGVQTAANILGCQQDDLLKEDNTQELRIFEAEDASNYPDWMVKKIEVKKLRLSKNDVFEKVEK